MDRGLYSDALGLAIFQQANRYFEWTPYTAQWVLLAVFAVGLVLIVATSLQRVPRLLAVGGSAILAVGLLAWNVTGEISAAAGTTSISRDSAALLGRPFTWVDDVAHGKPTLYFAQGVVDQRPEWLLEFWNRSISTVTSLDNSVLERVDLVRLSSERILVALTLAGGAVRTIFVEAKGEVADGALAEVTRVLNQRLAGSTMRQIRATLGERLRDTGPTATAAELLNVFIEEGEQLFDAALQGQDDTVLLGHASVLAEQPEFASVNSMRKLVALTEKSEDLADLLRKRSDVGGITISIGAEHSDPRLQKFTVVTAQYHAAGLSGVIGVIGPTRMPYEKVISLVTHTSKLITELLD
jgi:hypothetical protein